jgi:hypothetical protein
MEAVDRWRDLLAAVDVDDVRELAEMLADAPVEGLGAKLGAVVDGAVEALLVHDEADDLVSLLRPTFDRAQDDDSGTIVSGRGVVSAGVLLASLGNDTDPEGVLADWIEVAARDASTVSDADRHDFALACVALGQDDRVVDFVGGTIPTFEAGQVFGPDKPSFARYLVAAAEADAPVSDVVPAWTSFVLDFPAALQTGSVRWSCLLHAGYAVYTRFAGREPADVMTSIREFVAEMLEMG